MSNVLPVIFNISFIVRRENCIVVRQSFCIRSIFTCTFRLDECRHHRRDIISSRARSPTSLPATIFGGKSSRLDSIEDIWREKLNVLAGRLCLWREAQTNDSTNNQYEYESNQNLPKRFHELTMTMFILPDDDGGNAMFILPDDDEDDIDNGGGNTSRRGGGGQALFSFSQVGPDQSQTLEAARDHELRKLNDLNPTARNRIVTDLSRMLLFKGLSGDAIDRTKVVAEAMGDHKDRVASAVLSEAESRLHDVFGFAVRRVPAKMEQDLPSRYKNRLYLINDVADDEHGTHSLNIHSSHLDSSVEKGVLMTILAFAFCKGSSQVRSGAMKGAGKKTRWITEHQLYSLLHRVDENIPSEPPSTDGKKRSRLSSEGSGRKSLSPTDTDGDGGVGQTPDIDALLEKFVQLDYLLRDKIEEPDGRESSQAGEDGKVTAYAMGPRSAMEVGRKQIIYFCSNILDEQPDPTMLAEVDEDEDNDEEEDEGAAGED
jgi:hypothetical protein